MWKHPEVKQITSGPGLDEKRRETLLRIIFCDPLLSLIMTRQTVSVYKSCFGLGSPPETRSVLVCSQKLKDVESIVKIVELNGDDLVKDYSDEIERMLGSKMKSVKVRTRRRLQSKPVCTGWMDQCTDQQKPLSLLKPLHSAITVQTIHIIFCLIKPIKSPSDLCMKHLCASVEGKLPLRHTSCCCCC